MSRYAVVAAERSGVELLALTRPPWVPQAGDRWQRVAGLEDAVAALTGPMQRVLLAIGRMHLADFAAQPQHHYLLRLVDRPDSPPPLPYHTVTVDRGPFTLEATWHCCASTASNAWCARTPAVRGRRPSSSPPGSWACRW